MIHLDISRCFKQPQSMKFLCYLVELVFLVRLTQDYMGPGGKVKHCVHHGSFTWGFPKPDLVLKSTWTAQNIIIGLGRTFNFVCPTLMQNILPKKVC